MFVTWRKKEKKTIKWLIFVKSDRLKHLLVGDAPNFPSKWLTIPHSR